MMSSYLQSFTVIQHLGNCQFGSGFMMSSYLQLFTERYGGACDWEIAVDCGDRPVCDDCDDNCQPHHGGK